MESLIGSHDFLIPKDFDDNGKDYLTRFFQTYTESCKIGDEEVEFVTINKCRFSYEILKENFGDDVIDIITGVKNDSVRLNRIKESLTKIVGEIKYNYSIGEILDRTPVDFPLEELLNKCLKKRYDIQTDMIINNIVIDDNIIKSYYEVIEDGSPLDYKGDVVNIYLKHNLNLEEIDYGVDFIQYCLSCHHDNIRDALRGKQERIIGPFLF